MELSDEAYARYSKALDGHAEEKIIKLKQELFSKRGSLAHTQKESTERALSIGTIKEDSPIYAPNMKRLEDLTNKQIALEDDIRKLEEKVTTPASN